MFTRGYAKHPCTQHVYSQGFAVDRVERYRRERRCLRGGPLCILLFETSVSSERLLTFRHEMS